MHVYVYIHIYIYIYICRERDLSIYLSIYLSIIICIYVDMQREREREFDVLLCLCCLVYLMLLNLSALRRRTMRPLRCSWSSPRFEEPVKSMPKGVHFGAQYLWVALPVLRYLSDAASFVLSVSRRVKEHHNLPLCSRLLRKTCVRRVVLDKWFPLSTSG